MADAPYAGALNTAIAQVFPTSISCRSITLFEPTQDHHLFGEYDSVTRLFR